jgi:hypothetical protein
MKGIHKQGSSGDIYGNIVVDKYDSRHYAASPLFFEDYFDFTTIPGKKEVDTGTCIFNGFTCILWIEGKATGRTGNCDFANSGLCERA